MEMEKFGLYYDQGMHPHPLSNQDSPKMSLRTLICTLIVVENP